MHIGLSEFIKLLSVKRSKSSPESFVKQVILTISKRAWFLLHTVTTHQLSYGKVLIFNIRNVVAAR